MKNSVADPFPCPEKERSRQIQKDSNFRVQQNRPCQKHRIKIDDILFTSCYAIRISERWVFKRPFSRFIQSFFKLNAIAKKNSRCFVKRLGFTSNCKASASSVGVPLYSGISSDSKAATFSRIESGGICHSSVSDFSNSQTRRSSLMP